MWLVRGRAISVLLVLLVAYHSRECDVDEPSPLQEVRMTPYSKIFADYRRSSYQDYGTQATGSESRLFFETDNEGEWPRVVLVVENGIAIVYDARVRVVGFDGSILWERRAFPGFDVFVNEGLVYYRSGINTLATANMDGAAVLEDVFIFTSNETSTFPLVIPWSPNQFLAQTFVRKLEEFPDTGPDRYYLILMGTEDYDDWSYLQEFEGNVLPGVVMSDGKRIVVLEVGGVVRTVDGDTGSILDTWTLEGLEFYAASLTADDELIVTYLTEDSTLAVAAFGLSTSAESDTLQPLWDTDFGRGTLSSVVQPPALGNDGRVYVIVSSQVACIEHG
ncbi:MAG: PQQ-binding-like beta-propeller repeat protein, partial [Rhodothermales bacterium]|nr:PQQ-binding-like beta-propeller repeat protein [Rhodothermales bacterium]